MHETGADRTDRHGIAGAGAQREGDEDVASMRRASNSEKPCLARRVLEVRKDAQAPSKYGFDVLA
jgi:hypothetical protein